MRLIKPADLQADEGALGVQQDPALGIVFVSVGDCPNHPAAGVQVTTSISGLRPVYDGSLTATETDSTGIVTFFNVPVGTNVDLTASPAALGGKASSRVTVLVRGGWTTSTLMVPTP